MTQQQLEEVVAAYAHFDEFVFDVETRGEYRGRPERAEVAWIGLAGPGRTDVIPMGHINGKLLTPARIERTMHRNPDGTARLSEEGKRRFDQTQHPPTFESAPKQLWPSRVFEALEPLFFSERRKVGHNIKFDLTAVAQFYKRKIPPPPYGDTITVVHLLNEKLGAYRLDYIIKKIYGMEYSDGKIGRVGIDSYDFMTVAHYLRLDVFFTWLLWHDYYPHIAKQELTRVFNVEMGVLEALVYMEREGAPIDMKMMDTLSTRVDKRVVEITEELYRDFGKPWNLDNPIAKGHYVYEHRGNDVRYVTAKKKQPSAKAAHLAQFARKDPMVRLLVEYADLAKLKSTYLDGMRKRMVEHKLHPVFLQAGTETGRFSCANPNLQNLPRDSEERKEFSIRSLFVAPPGHVLIVGDYSQIEYRLFAHFSQDPHMTMMFRDGIDAHSATASMILNKHPDKLTSDERQIYGKTVNFALRVRRRAAYVGGAGGHHHREGEEHPAGARESSAALLSMERPRGQTSQATSPTSCGDVAGTQAPVADAVFD